MLALRAKSAEAENRGGLHPRHGSPATRSIAWAPPKTIPGSRKLSTNSSRSLPTTGAEPSYSTYSALRSKTSPPGNMPCTFAQNRQGIPPKASAPKSARGLLSRLEAVGKPFDLTFNDAISGTEISMQKLRGKIVVVDFWATWCGPCVAEMPRMKELYAKYHGKGVEFIGVSLDYSAAEGGLDRLKAFVAKNEIPWPQYYQGHGWESDFSRGLGIDSIPTMFLVDQQGKLFSLDARARLETLIIELMNRKALKDPRPK